MQMALSFRNGCTFLDAYAAGGVNACGGFATPKKVTSTIGLSGLCISSTFFQLHTVKSNLPVAASPLLRATG